MALNILDAVTSLLPNDLVSKAAQSLGENESSVQSGLQAAIPSIFAGLLSNASDSNSGAGILNLVKTAASGNITENISGLLNNTDAGGGIAATVMGWLKTLLGDKLGSVASAIASFAGLKSSSANSLLSLAAPALLGAVGKHVTSNNLNASGLLSFLQDQKSAVMSAAPSGFNFGSLGLGSLGNLGGQVTSHVSDAAHRAGQGVGHAADFAGNTVKKGSNWLWPLLLLLGLAALIWFLTQKGCSNADTTAVTTDTTDTTVAPGADTATTTIGESVRALGEVELPGGVKLQAYPGGIEDQLVKFIQSDEYKNADDEALKQKWFSFDDLNFEFGTTKLTAESKRQLDNIVAILKAYPEVKLKVGAYTDKKGSDEANKKLSDSRAKAVQAALGAAGVGAQVPESEGYGEQFATVDENASDKEREADRKTAVRLIKK